MNCENCKYPAVCKAGIVISVLAVLSGGGYYAWRRFFNGKPDISPPLPLPESKSNDNVAELKKEF